MSTHSTNEPVRYKSLSFLGYPKYRVGDDGSVWSCCNNRHGTTTWKQKLPTFSQGCYVVGLWHEGRTKVFLVHRLVLLAFVGPYPEGMEVCHFPDRDTSNNRLENLQWGTRKENQGHRAVHETDNKGERHPMVKLTEEQVREIRRRSQAGERPCHLHKEFGVNEATIRDIRNRKSWRHI